MGQKLKIFIMAVILTGCVVLQGSEVKSILKMEFDQLPSSLVGSGKLVPGNGGKGKALKLNGKGYLQFAPSAELQAAEKSGTFTFECWFYREDDDDQGFLIRHNGSFAVRVIPWDPRRINVGIFIPGGYISLDSEACLKSGVWQHIAVVITPQDAELLVDGKRIFKRPLKHPSKASTHPVAIGAGLDGKKVISMLTGCIDKVEITAGVKDKSYFDAIAADTSETFEAIYNTVGMPPECAEGKNITEKAVPAVSEIGENIVKVENSFYIAEIEVKPALRIKRLFNKFTGSECFNEKGSPVFTVNLNTSARRENPASFKVSSVKKNNKDGVCKLAVTSVHPAGVEMDIVLSFDASEKIGIDSVMRNGSKAMRLMPSVPLLENISIGNDFNENWYFHPSHSGWAGKKSFEVALGYGFRSWLQFADVFSPALGGGLALSGQDTEGVAKGIITRKTKKNGKVGVIYNLCWLTNGEKEPVKLFDEKSTGLGMGFIYLPDNFAAGETFRMPKAEISVHRGDVLIPLMEYAKWSKKAFPHAPMPERAKKEFNYLAVHRRAGNAGYSKGFETDKGISLIDKIAPDGSDHQLQLAFWWQRYESGKVPNKIGSGYIYKNSSGEGDYLYDTSLGGLEGLRKEIQACAEKGSNVVLYTCSRVAGDDSDVVKNHPDWALHSTRGVPNRSWGCFNVCTAIPQWQDMYAAVNARIVRDLPVSGVYLDTTAEFLRCQNPAHPHPRNPVDGIKSLLQKMRTAVKSVDPEAVIMTEYMGSEVFGMYIDACWVQTFAHPHAHAFNNYDLDFARFVYPRMKFAEWGQTPRTFSVDSPRAFFNGIGATRGDLNNEQKLIFADRTNAQKEMYDALATENPQPFVTTLTKNVFINFFPGEKQTAWTYYNKAGDLKNAPLLKVAQGDAAKRFVELVSDREIPVKDGKISLDMADCEVGMIAAFDRLLEVRDNGEMLQISVAGNVPESVRLVVVGGGKRDSKDNYSLVVNGKRADIKKSVLGKGKVIIKLYDDELLIDEIINNN